VKITHLFTGGGGALYEGGRVWNMSLIREFLREDLWGVVRKRKAVVTWGRGNGGKKRPKKHAEKPKTKE